MVYCGDCDTPDGYSIFTYALLQVVPSPPALFILQDSLYLVELGATEASPRVLGWERMRRLAAEGVTFAPHGVHHDHQARPVSGESPDERRARLAADIRGSLERLRAELGDECNERHCNRE